jgi:hypothetical protein
MLISFMSQHDIFSRKKSKRQNLRQNETHYENIEY